VSLARNISNALAWVRNTGRTGFALAASMLVAGAFAAPAVASAAAPPDASSNFMFTTLIDQHDPTFNQLLGINNSGLIAGYFGSGDPGHPNKGYELVKPYGQGSFKNENFPGSAQTQVTGLNDTGVTVGFWVNGAGANQGFYAIHRKHFKTVDFPTGDNASPIFDQLLGVNDSEIAVGFYNDSAGNPHGFTYNIRSHRYRVVRVSGDTGVTATAINNLGDVAGIATNGAGNTEGFLRRADGKVFHLNYPGASATQAFGVNDGDEVVGAYTVGTGDNAPTHGFIWSPDFGFANVDDPNGIGSTLLNGINDRGTLVGFYTDSAGNTDGLLAHSNL
jgi:hypothetical protein